MILFQKSLYNRYSKASCKRLTPRGVSSKKKCQLGSPRSRGLHTHCSTCNLRSGWTAKGPADYLLSVLAAAKPHFSAPWTMRSTLLWPSISRTIRNRSSSVKTRRITTLLWMNPTKRCLIWEELLTKWRAVTPLKKNQTDAGWARCSTLSNSKKCLDKKVKSPATIVLEL